MWCVANKYDLVKDEESKLIICCLLCTYGYWTRARCSTDRRRREEDRGRYRHTPICKHLILLVIRGAPKINSRIKMMVINNTIFSSVWKGDRSYFIR